MTRITMVTDTYKKKGLFFSILLSFFFLNRLSQSTKKLYILFLSTLLLSSLKYWPLARDAGLSTSLATQRCCTALHFRCQGVLQITTVIANHSTKETLFFKLHMKNNRYIKRPISWDI